MNKGGFSWKRLVGVTKAKQQISRKIGIPLTRSGRQRKIGKAIGGCYIATAVYGSYDHPKVIFLRNYRDDILSKYFIGKLFIKSYYKLSPMVLRLFGKKYYFIKYSRIILDKFIECLNYNNKVG